MAEKLFVFAFALGGGFGVEERLVDMSLARFKASSSPRIGDGERSLSLSSSAVMERNSVSFLSAFGYLVVIEAG